MVQNVKCQLVKSSKHKHENGVKLDRLSLNPLVCVCVQVCICDSDLVSVGVVDVFRGQRWDHRRFSLTLDVHRQQHWLGREMNVLNCCTFPPPMSWLQQSLGSVRQPLSWRERRGRPSHVRTTREEILSWVWLVIKVQQDRVEEVCSHRSEDMNNCQRTLKHREPTSTITFTETRHTFPEQLRTSWNMF